LKIKGKLKMKMREEGWGVAQVIERLPRKHKAQSSNACMK
jgi:hypothetical protein